MKNKAINLPARHDTNMFENIWIAIKDKFVVFTYL